MSKSEYTANLQGFVCIKSQAFRQVAPVKQAQGINVFHVVGYIVVACVLAGCYF